MYYQYTPQQEIENNIHKIYTEKNRKLHSQKDKINMETGKSNNNSIHNIGYRNDTVYTFIKIIEAL